MSDKKISNRYLSGRSKVIGFSGLSSDRHLYIAPGEVEPNLGYPGEKTLPLAETYYRLVTVPNGTVYDRYWEAIPPVELVGGISIFDEGILVGTANSVSKINFVGTGVTASASGSISTITIDPIARVSVSTEPPGTAGQGDLWWDSDSGELYLYYEDGDSNQWVETSGGSETVTISDDPPPSANSGDLWWESDTGTLHIYYDDGDSSQWVDANAGILDNVINYWVGSDSGIHTLSYVGVGTTNPQYNLDVGGDINFTGSLYQNGQEFSLGIGIASTSVNPYSGVINLGSRIGTGFTDINLVGRGLNVIGYGKTVVIDFDSIGANVSMSTEAPSSPISGDLWWDTDDGELKIYYNDGSSSQWVSANGADSLVQISSTAPSISQSGDLWWNNETGDLLVYYNDGSNSQWVSANNSNIQYWVGNSAGIHSLGPVGIATTNPRYSLEVGPVGYSGTSLWVNGDARITGILSVGQGTVSINGNTNQILVGTGVTVYGNTGIISATKFYANKFYIDGAEAVGPQGAQGFQGFQGVQGSQGRQGAQGAQGITGSQGPQGATGSQGFQGFTGSQGPQGAIGSQGFQGVQGATGSQGVQGAQGAQGFQGFQGIQGANGTLGTQGPQGAQGAQGATGSQGVQGATGSGGSTGTQGPQGAQGAQGATGSQGVQGATGSGGSTGTQGPQGAQGYQGFQGFQGVQGALGAQGSTGSSGTAVAGAVEWFAMSTAPSGWIKANGAAVSRSTYSTLFSAIGTTFGTGDGSTTFNVPDLRGEFIRGWDDSRGVDSGRTFGSSQADDFKSHTHQLNGVYLMNSSAQAGNSGARTNDGGAAAYTYGTGGTETRPRNIALLVCIKY